VNEYLDCGNDSSLDFEYTDTFTYSCWINATTLSGSQMFMSNRASYGTFFYFSSANANNLRWNVANNNSKTMYREGATNLSTGTWYHVAAVFGGQALANNHIYLNGTEETYTGNKSDQLNSNSIIDTVNFELGAYNGTSGPFDGYMDEVSVWNTALDASEISEIYNSGCPNDLSSHSASANLVSWWKMGEGATHPTINDEVGSNTATMTNTESGDIQSGTPC